MQNICAHCRNGELHGFSHTADKMGYPVTVSFYCQVKKHHNPNSTCELHENGEPKKFYDDIDW